MSTVATHTPTAPATTRTRSWSRIACAASAVGAAAPFALLSLSGDSGTEITAGLVEDRVPLILGTYVAVLVSAGMFAAAVHLGRRLPDVNGILVTASGSAVALMYAAYYAVFGAGAVIASGESGPGLGEAAWHALNVMEIARYAPGLALVVAAVAAGPRLPRAVRVTAGALVVLTLVPLTSWVAALLIPVWLCVSAAVTIPRSPARP